MRKGSMSMGNKASTAALAILASVGSLAVLLLGETSQSLLRLRSGELLQVCFALWQRSLFWSSWPSGLFCGGPCVPCPTTTLASLSSTPRTPPRFLGPLLGDCASSGSCIVGVDRRALLEGSGSTEATLRLEDGQREGRGRPQVASNMGLQGAGLPVAPAPEEVRVVLMSQSWFGPELFAFEGTNPCDLHGRPLVCRFGNSSQLDIKAAAALWFHTPHLSAGYIFPHRAFPGQAFVAASAEPPDLFPRVSSAAFLSSFDVVASYRRDSALPIVSQPFDIRTSDEAALPSFEARQAAVWYINSNCRRTPNGRAKIVEELLSRHSVPVHAMGKCLHNTPAPAGTERSAFPDNHQWQQGYRVCIAMENSNTQDYVTEKVWNALRAGCVPVYMGPPNARADFLPANDYAIFVDDFESVGALAAEIKRVLFSREAWERFTAWRGLSFEQLNVGYRTLLTQPTDIPTCRLCQLLASRRSAGSVA